MNVEQTRRFSSVAVGFLRVFVSKSFSNRLGSAFCQFGFSDFGPDNVTMNAVHPDPG
jgi:hypothetical protein